MSVEDRRQLYAKEEAVREDLVELIIQLSAKRKIDWDFSCFDDSVYGQMARAEYKGIMFVCCDWQDTGIEFKIITKEKGKVAGEEKEVERIVGSFRGHAAMRLRHFLGLLASKDPTLKQIRRKEKARYRGYEEAGRKKREENTKKLGEIVQLLQTQSQPS